MKRFFRTDPCAKAMVAGNALTATEQAVDKGAFQH